MYLEIENFTKIIDGQKVLKDITISMNKGMIYRIKGKNGSGKTMLLRGISGLIKPTKGRVIVDGDVLGVDISFPKSIGILIEQAGFIPSISGYDNLKMLGDIKGLVGKDEIEQTMEDVGLERSTFKKKYKAYSLGMKQKLGIAAAIMEKPDLILLDEPTNALDKESVNKVVALLQKEKERGALIIITSHDLEELNDLSDKIFIMEAGRIKESI